jgi:stringent starvation protein B
MKSPDLQEFHSRFGGLERALEVTLFALSSCLARSGGNPREMIEFLRDKTVADFKNSEVPPEKDMEHAALNGPAIDAVITAFDGFLKRLPT